MSPTTKLAGPFLAAVAAVLSLQLAPARAHADGAQPYDPSRRTVPAQARHGAIPDDDARMAAPDLRPLPHPAPRNQRSFALGFEERRVLLPIVWSLAALVLAAGAAAWMWQLGRWRWAYPLTVALVTAAAASFFAENPVPLGVLGLLTLGAALATTLARERPRTLVALALVLAVNAALRAWLSPETVQGMSNYSREPILVPWLLDLELPILDLFPEGMDRKALATASNFAMSCALPLLLFALARTLFSEVRVALFGAAAFAILPLAIFFGAGDSQMIGSMALSTACLFLQRRAIAAPRYSEAILYGAGCAAVYVGAMASRELDFLIAGVALVPTLELLWRRPPRFWLGALWGPLLVATFLFTQAARGGVGNMVQTAVQGLPHFWPSVVNYNNYFLPTLFPLAFTGLALLAVPALWRRQRFALLFLAAWFFGFYLAHGVVFAKNLLATARYALHSLVPLLLAVAVGADAWLRFCVERATARPWLARLGPAALAALVAASVPFARAMFDDGVSDVQEEYAFLRELSSEGLPEAGALVVEPYGPPLGDALPPKRRFEYFGQRARGGELRVELGSSDRLAPHVGPVYLYAGLPCLWLREGDAPRSRACEAALTAAPWKLVRARALTGWSHDFSNGQDAAPRSIALYRLDARKDAPPPARKP